jgi:hypothetical protein
MPSLKTFIVVLCLVSALCFVAPNAQADTLFVYTYSDPVDGYSWTTTAIPAVTMGTTVPAADLTAASTSGPLANCGITSVILDESGLGFTGTNFSGALCPDGGTENGDRFAFTDYSTPGTYVSPTLSFVTLVVTAPVGAPEPSSAALMLLGVALVFVMRKCLSGLQQAS